MEALKGQKTLTQLSMEYWVHPNQISFWKKELPEKVSRYQFCFNYLRKNSYKGDNTPAELFRTALHNFDDNRYLSFSSVDLDELLVKLFLKGYTMTVNSP